MDQTVLENLSLLLASFQSAGDFDPEHLPEDFDQVVERQLPRWRAYLENQAKTLQKAVAIFKSYANGKLDYLWDSIAQGNPQLDEPTFERLMQYATQAYENGVLKDAHQMFSLIIAFFPLHLNGYLYLGQTIEQLAGFEEAALFYKSATQLFKAPELLFLAANCALQLSHEDEAKSFLEEALAGLNQRSDASEYDMQLCQHVKDALAAF